MTHMNRWGNNRRDAVLSRLALSLHRSMEGLSGAASVIAVVDLSAKVASLCFQYLVAVKDAK
jgi:hypothetical protein